MVALAARRSVIIEDGAEQGLDTLHPSGPEAWHGHSQPKRENRKMWPQDNVQGTITFRPQSVPQAAARSEETFGSPSKF